MVTNSDKYPKGDKALLEELAKTKSQRDADRSRLVLETKDEELDKVLNDAWYNLMI